MCADSTIQWVRGDKEYLKILPQTRVFLLDRTVAWSGVSMRVCPRQCVTCKSVRVDEFDDFVRRRECERFETV